jgi:SAM-dependent methyltransferase
MSSNKKSLSSSDHSIEIAHWNEVERRARTGDRQFWLNHPRVAYHYQQKALVDGLIWQQWVLDRLGRPAHRALELGCGDGTLLAQLAAQRVFEKGFGLDLDESRFYANQEDSRIRFIAGDVNTLQFEKNYYDLIYACQSFHHFEALENIMEQVYYALKPKGLFVLDEFVGPSRFQWTDEQLAFTSYALGLMPKHLRIYANGIEKRAEGRSPVEEVVRVCPSEAIRSSEIPTIFRSRFHVLHERNLGGTMQHLLYSGIVQNFPDHDADIDYIIDCVDALETALIERRILPSDFILLIGERDS